MKDVFNTKTIMRIVGIIVMVTVIGFSMTACDSGGGDDGPKPVTYSGTTNDGYTVSLKITGDDYEFTLSKDGKSLTSKGTVKSKSGDTLILLPSNAATPNTTFTATVSEDGLTTISGTVTWTNGETTTTNGPVAYTPSGGPGSGKTPGGNSNTGGWIKVADSTFGDSTIAAIAFGNGKFVAVGRKGKMAYSSDGISWIAIPAGTGAGTSTFGTDSIDTIAYGNGMFVAGGGKIAYSSDGVSWTAIPQGTGAGQSGFTDSINGITYAGGKFIAGGDMGTIGYSSDGISWTVTDKTNTQKIFGTTTNDSVDAIAYGGSRYVAVGNKSGYGGRMAYSSDGVSWTEVVDERFGKSSGIGNNGGFSDIAYGNGKFVTGDGYGNIGYSSDGISWTIIDGDNIKTPGYPGVLTGVHSIAYVNNKFVAGCSYGQIMTSADGITWKVVDLSSFGNTADYSDMWNPRGIAYGNGTIVAVGGYGIMAYSKQ